MTSDNLREVLESESQAFRSNCRQWYIDSANELNHPIKVDDTVLCIGSSPAKIYIQAGLSALQNHKLVLVGGRGSNLGKAVAVVEQIKQQIVGSFVQFNKTSLHSSLINPAYKPSASQKNVDVFLKESDPSQDSNLTQQSSLSANDVLREVKGHKVYKVPSVAILLAIDAQTAERKLSGWTKQIT